MASFDHIVHGSVEHLRNHLATCAALDERDRASFTYFAETRLRAVLLGSGAKDDLTALSIVHGETTRLVSAALSMNRIMGERDLFVRHDVVEAMVNLLSEVL